jgi:hypothetical protein
VPGARRQQGFGGDPKRAAIECGFPPGNIHVWDETSARGLEDAMDVMRVATQGYMDQRARGVRQSVGLFTPQVEHLSPDAIKQTGDITELHFGQYRLLDVLPEHCGEPKGKPKRRKADISEFVRGQTGRELRLGEAFYQLTDPVEVQAKKLIALHDKATAKLYVGTGTRKLLGFDNTTRTINPAQHDRYTIFVQSTSLNRALLENTKLVLLPEGWEKL